MNLNRKKIAYIYASASSNKECQSQISKIMSSLKTKFDFILFSDICKQTIPLFDRSGFNQLKDHMLSTNNERIIYIFNKKILGDNKELTDNINQLNMYNIKLISIKKDLEINYKIIVESSTFKKLKRLKFNKKIFYSVIFYMVLINLPAIVSLIYLIYSKNLIIPSFDIHDIGYMVDKLKELMPELNKGIEGERERTIEEHPQEIPPQEKTPPQQIQPQTPPQLIQPQTPPQQIQPQTQPQLIKSDEIVNNEINNLGNKYIKYLVYYGTDLLVLSIGCIVIYLMTKSP